MQDSQPQAGYHSNYFAELQAKSPGRSTSLHSPKPALRADPACVDWLDWNGYRVYTQRDSSHGLFRKEVIQPQVLLRLPCYDFTPIMSHTLGRCLPCGLARELLVQPTFVM